jgi:ATP-dependent helicase HrpA
MTKTDIDNLIARAETAMLRDRHFLRRRLRGLERSLQDGRPIDHALAQVTAEIDRSVRRREDRLKALPKPTYPEHLPVVERREEIKQAIAKNQVIVLCGETGSGKTTQLPKICLELGRGVAGLIGHTQPRRIAARTVAKRISEEMESTLGQSVGFKVRFADSLSENTYIKLMTDGILLAETQGDPYLEQYDTIIIDEAHERSLNIDFLLGYLKQLLPKRPDLKLIITSATIDPQRFSKHFNDAPMVMVSGRTYPVEVRYRPLQSDDPEEEDLLMEEGILAAVDEVCREGRGDVLVFLSGEREIRETAEALRKHHPPETEILPLFSRLNVDEQMKIFKPHGRRRIVLATNVAETSLTVPGIGYVVDTGHARISRYNARTKVQRLPIESISRASADQRKGRCGRIGPGVCIRLFSEEDFTQREEFTPPEILRTNLASVILQMKSLRLGEIQDFPFIEPPDYRQIRDGYQTLHELGAIDENNELTQLGSQLARLPIDPRIGRMVLAAREEGVLEEVLIIASALTVQDPRERPMDMQQAADEAHAKWRDENSDFVAYLNLWRWYEEKRAHLSTSQLRKACRTSFLSFMRMREWRDVYHQLKDVVGELPTVGDDRRGGRGPRHRHRSGAPVKQGPRETDPTRVVQGHGNNGGTRRVEGPAGENA